MNASNLPPGCSSPDGGIDHLYEGALDHLTEAMETADDVNLMRRLADTVLPWVRQTYSDGVRDGRAMERDEQAQTELADTKSKLSDALNLLGMLACEFPEGTWQRRDIEKLAGTYWKE